IDPRLAAALNCRHEMILRCHPAGFDYPRRLRHAAASRTGVGRIPSGSGPITNHRHAATAACTGADTGREVEIGGEGEAETRAGGEVENSAGRKAAAARGEAEGCTHVEAE